MLSNSLVPLSSTEYFSVFLCADSLSLKSRQMVNDNNSLNLYNTSQETQGCFTCVSGDKKREEKKVICTEQDRNKQHYWQGGAVPKTKGLSEQVVFETFFKDVQGCSVADFGRERVPEGGLRPKDHSLVLGMEEVS